MKNSRRKDKIYTFDDVFNQLKSLGRYQHCAYWFLASLKIPMSSQFIFLIFPFGTQKFECVSNTTCPINQCCNNCTSYSFENTYVSAVSEWGLICDRAYITALMQSAYFWGMLLGSVIGGWISDKFGRKKCVFGNIFLVSLISLCTAFVDSPIALAVLRLFVGFAIVSYMLSQYALGIEIVGPTKRTFAGTVTALFWKVGGIFNVGIIYLLPYWRHTVIACSALGFLFVPVYIIFPESPRWLVAHGRLDEAQAILTKFGAINDKPVDTQQLRSTLEKVREEQLSHQANSKTYHVTDLCKTPRLRRFSLILCYNWFVVAMLYFAMFMFVARLYGDIYINAILAYLVDIPAMLVMWICAARFGRRITYIVIMFTAAAALMTLPFIPKDILQVRTVLALTGKSFLSCEFTLVYMQTSELVPTVVRNLSLGTGSMSARIGAILAPFFVMMAQLPGVSLIVPLCIFGVLAIVAAVLAMFLPETLFVSMEQTIEGTENAKLDYHIPCCGKRPEREEVKLGHELEEEDDPITTPL